MIPTFIFGQTALNKAFDRSDDGFAKFAEILDSKVPEPFINKDLKVRENQLIEIADIFDLNLL